MRANVVSTLLLTLAAAALMAGCKATSADDALVRVKQKGQLTVGVNYVVPAYAAGAKFRTPEAIDTALAEDVAKRLKVPLAAVPARSQADLVLTALPEDAPSPAGHTVVPTGYAAGPMAIMRSDTDIKSWEQLRGRKVCLAEGGLYGGMIASRYGAIEKVYKAPADSLLALRTGGCDAAVHDSAMLEELIKLPEWKKFSARLPVGPRMALSFVVPESDEGTAAFLKQVASEWRASDYPDQTMKKMVRDIAFEVYLDQDVPDCH